MCGSWLDRNIATGKDNVAKNEEVQPKGRGRSSVCQICTCIGIRKSEGDVGKEPIAGHRYETAMESPSPGLHRRRNNQASKIEQPCTSLQTLGGKPSPLKEWHLKRNCIAFAIGNSISQKKTCYTGVVPTSVFEGNSAWWELKDLAIHVELRNFQCQVFNTSLCVATHASHL